MIHFVVQWFLHFAGLDDGSGAWYLFWSGFIGAVEGVAGLAVLGGLLHLAMEHNCQVKGCWRFGFRKTDAGHHACKKHHPNGGNMTVEELHRHHREASG